MILALAVSVFVIFKSITIEGIERFWKVNRLCFAVYLIHPMFIQFTYRFLKVTPVKLTELYPIAAVAFFIEFVIVAFIEAWILNMIKPLRKYVL